jgi:nucleotide-binding universal stress UspA family protein
MPVTAKRRALSNLPKRGKRGRSRIRAHTSAPPTVPALAPLHRILCPVDFSACSPAAIGEAVTVARACGGEITALFVFPIPPAAGGEAGAGGESPEPEPAVRWAVAEDLINLLRPAWTSGVAVWLGLKTGDPATAILAQAEALRTDVIVMGTHGRAGVNRWLLGSVTNQVLRRAPCPVLTVSPAAQTEPRPDKGGVGRILCALDLHESSGRTLAHALSLGRAMGAPVTVLHVLDAGIAAPAPSIFAASARERLHELVAAHGAPGCAVAELVVPGHARRQILRVAKDEKAGLIVLGVHGRGPVDRLFLGSTADHVVRHAPVPVLTVRAPEGDSTL